MNSKADQVYSENEPAGVHSWGTHHTVTSEHAVQSTFPHTWLSQHKATGQAPSKGWAAGEQGDSGVAWEGGRVEDNGWIPRTVLCPEVQAGQGWLR